MDARKWMKTRTKPQIFISFLMLSAITATTFLSLATQQFAKSQNYHPALDQVSAPIYKHYYKPLAIADWKKQYYDQAKEEFDKSMIFVYIALGSGVILLMVGILIIKGKKPALTTHGSARWATEEELDQTGLTKPEGVMLGVTKGGKYIRHNGPEHIICYAPTRSGKGVGIIIPSLLSWKHSVVVTDIKGENWGITSGYRKAKLNNKVIKFDPTCVDGSGARFNPLEEIRFGTPDEVKDTQRIVTMIVDTGGKGELDHWGKTASALLVGLILYVLYCEKEKNLSRVADIINNPEEEDIGESLRMMAERDHADPRIMKQLYGVETAVHPKIWNSLLECANKPDNERGSVISTAVSNLALYRDPIIKHNISKSDFKIRDLMNYDTPVSLYIVIPPSDLDRVVPLTRIIINQIITSLTEKMDFVDGKPVVAYKHKLLLLIDEFPAFGKIESLEKALAFIAGYGLKALLIIQSLNQINKAYTKDNSILDNCHIRIAYTPNDNHTAEEISKSLGDSTILVDSYGYDKGFNFMGPRKTGRSGQSRKLMTAGEVMVMPPDDEIVFVAGFPPYKAKKIFYWKDGNFKKRLLPNPPTSDKTQITTEDEPETETSLPPEFNDDMRDIALSVQDFSPMMQHQSSMPFGLHDATLVEPDNELIDYETEEMMQRIRDNGPTDETRQNSIDSNSFIDTYDDLADFDYDQLEQEVDDIKVM